MKKQLTFLFCFIIALGFSQTNNVGINTTNPQQKLHIAGPEATMRITALDSLNNTLNRYEENAALYATKDGVLTLDQNLFSNTSSDLNIYTIHQVGNVDGENKDVEFFVDTITVDKPSYVEIKFTISFEVYKDTNENILDDKLARAIRNYILLDNNPVRKYGMTSKVYINDNNKGTYGTYYNNASTYIKLPAAGTYTLHFYGSVGSGATDRNTYVKFGTHQDMFLVRVF